MINTKTNKIPHRLMSITLKCIELSSIKLSSKASTRTNVNGRPVQLTNQIRPVYNDAVLAKKLTDMQKLLFHQHERSISYKTTERTLGVITGVRLVQTYLSQFAQKMLSKCYLA